MKKNKTLLSNKAYDILKKIALYVLPASEVLCISLGNIWNIPYANAVGATIAAIGTFLGGVLGVSTHQYNKANGGDADEQKDK